ncbi:DNA repair protein RAD5 [Coprinopsis cinerea AmutBmut pab1-1]|nr:DNA repair protein RAD5 [Coprinopsis cinerea AmutBmut pab1-1]
MARWAVGDSRDPFRSMGNRSSGVGTRSRSAKVSVSQGQIHATSQRAVGVATLDVFQFMGNEYEGMGSSRLQQGTPEHRRASDISRSIARRSARSSSPSSDSDSSTASYHTAPLSTPPPSPPRQRQRQLYSADVTATSSHGAKPSSHRPILLPKPSASRGKRPAQALAVPVKPEHDDSTNPFEGASTRSSTSRFSNQLALNTPPPSTKQTFIGYNPSTGTLIKQEPGSEDEFPPSPTRVPVRRTAAPVKREQEAPLRTPLFLPPPSRKLHPSVKFENDNVPSTSKLEPTSSTSTPKRRGFLATGTTFPNGLATPESSPVKQAPASRPRSSDTDNMKQEDTNVDPSSSEPETQKTSAKKVRGPFQPFSVRPLKVARLKAKQKTEDGNLTVEYCTDNGHTLKWFQQLDFQDIVAETLARERMRLDKDDDLLKDVAQGKILNYHMGLGKTHVALAVVAESLRQLQMVCSRQRKAMGRKPVLVCAEKSLHEHWREHAIALFNFKVFVYTSGSQRIPEDADIVISTINMIGNHHKSAYFENQPHKAHMTQIHWFYVIVDEFQNHNNPETLGARALLRLEKDHVLLLSGTPAGNSLNDLQVPLALLQHPSKRPDFRRREHEAYHSGKKNRNPRAEHVVTYHNLENDVLIDLVFIRRLDEDKDLPPRTNLVIKIPFTEEERKAYDTVKDKVAGLPRLMRWRQGCLHPQLLVRAGILTPPGKTKSESEVDMDVVDEVKDEMDMDIDDDIVPYIHAKQETSEEDNVYSDKYLSGKFKVVLNLLRKIIGAREKVVIFSSYVTLLELLGECLDARRIKFIEFNGKKSTHERTGALDVIANDPRCHVMLISLKAGSVGLDITSCNNVILMDPWWNPFVEEQAISRVHRFGQTRPVTVYRIITPDTIEPRIQEIQQEKRTKVEAYLDMCAAITKQRDAVRLG